MKHMNASKYAPYPVLTLPGRTWPDRVIGKAPAWCSVDLRDGNQALSAPMNVEAKLAMFEALTAMGFKEIEVGFPSASETEYRFVRTLIEEKRIPEDVTIQVLTQARAHLIERTMRSLRGARSAIVHLYNSTSTAQREVVFRKNMEEIKAIAVEGARLVRALKQSAGYEGIRLEYSPESFTGTEPEYALEVCQAVMEAWQPTKDEKMIFNLPSTVEMSTPNVFADRIEWFCRNLRNRETAVLSVHTHNDRGTAVAAAELAVMAGAERVEGSLFGNGERSGNMDIVTMALNLFSRGIDPELDLSDIGRIGEMYTRCTRMDIPPRHPYAGELIFTAFSGSHQDAINKGMKAYAQSNATVWQVPYLPIDPGDIGRTYESIIRINSQSGKGGIAYVMEKEFGLLIPAWMQPGFGRVVQSVTDRTGNELSPTEIYECFQNEYVRRFSPYRLGKCRIDMEDDEQSPEKNNRVIVRAVVKAGDGEIEFSSEGNGPIDAFVKGLRQRAGIAFTLERYVEHAITQGSDSLAAAYVEIKGDGGEAAGAGIDANIGIASIKAVLCALNRVSGDATKN